MYFRSLKIFAIIFLLFTSSVNAQRRDLLLTNTDSNNLKAKKIQANNDCQDGFLYKIDVKIFRAINNNQGRFLNLIIPFSSESMIYTTSLIPITMLLVSRNNNNYHENSSVLLAFSEGLSVGITFAIKSIKKRERPNNTLSAVHIDSCNIPSDRYSFPSGHTSMTFSLATSLTLRYPDKPILITGLYLYSTVVSLGRIYLGVHYPSDVLAGMLIGSGSAALVHAFRKDLIKLKNNILCEKGREDVNQKSISASLIFTSFIASDILNLVLGKFNNKILNPNNIKFDLRGYENNVKFVYGF
jgi:undecaprenyl-diphosphatase